jgi:hypothetical protein
LSLLMFPPLSYPLIIFSPSDLAANRWTSPQHWH